MKRWLVLLLIVGCGEVPSTPEEALPVVSFSWTCEVATCAGDDHPFPADGITDQVCVWGCALYKGQPRSVSVRWHVNEGDTCYVEPTVDDGDCW